MAHEDVRQNVEYLISRNPVGRMLGLDGLSELVLQGRQPGPRAPDALPYLFALARCPRFPQASAVLRRLAIVMDELDHPPRSLCTRGAPDARTAQVVEAFEGQLSPLLRIARTSRDPESSRAAAHIVSRFPSVDGHLEPILLALLSGARDLAPRARLLHALTCIQAFRGGPFHRLIVQSLTTAGARGDRAAVAMALASQGGGGELESHIEPALREIAEASPETVQDCPDPSRWTDRDLQTAVRATLARWQGTEDRTSSD